MTPLPKRRLSTRRQGDRRSHFGISLVNLIICQNCKKFNLPHKVCRACGFYNGKLVKAPKQKGSKKSQ